jgi:hypothetical protein
MSSNVEVIREDASIVPVHRPWRLRQMDTLCGFYVECDYGDRRGWVLVKSIFESDVEKARLEAKRTKEAHETGLIVEAI